MANDLGELWKKGTTSPLTADVVEGGLAIDVQNKKAYSKGNDGALFEIGGGGSWGDIDGNISDQTDLQAELNNKVFNSDGFHSPIRNMVSLTQGQYDALTPPHASTLYIIVG